MSTTEKTGDLNVPTVELSIELPPEIADVLVGLLSTHGFQGFWEDGGTLRAYMPLDRWDDAARSAVHESVAAFAAGFEIPLPPVSTRVIQPQNWNAEWEATIRPVQVTPRMIIAPSWHPTAPPEGGILLIIDPKMSFGTGHHETTRLVLQLMEPRLRQGSTVLDVGTGTGVLAIAAVKLGAASATGVDIDEWSFENACENTAANGVQEQLTVLRGELHDVPPGQYDMVAANIQRSVIEPLLPGLGARLLPGGTLILAGLLTSERDRMLEAFREQHLTVTEERSEQEWIAFALTLRR